MIQKIQIDPLPSTKESLTDLARLFLRGPLHNQCKRQLTGLGLHSIVQNGVIPGIGDNKRKLLGIGGHQVEYCRLRLAGHLFAEMNQLIETVALSGICVWRVGAQQQKGSSLPAHIPQTMLYGRSKKLLHACLGADEKLKTYSLRTSQQRRCACRATSTSRPNLCRYSCRS